MCELAAYHEAGHALLATRVGARIRRVTIEPDRDDGPEREGDTQVEWMRGRWTEQEYGERSVWVALAGPVAEMIYRGEPYHPGVVAEWAADWQQAWDAASPLATHPQQRLRYLEQTTRHLYRLLNREDFWAALAAIADELLAT